MAALKPFEILYTRHEVTARKLLLSERFVDESILSRMSSEDVEKLINQNFIVLACADGDFMLVRNKDFDDVKPKLVFIRR